jgi:hypothetical protein
VLDKRKGGEMKIEVNYSQAEIVAMIEASHADAFGNPPDGMKWEVYLRTYGDCTITSVKADDPVETETKNDEA